MPDDDPPTLGQRLLKEALVVSDAERHNFGKTTAYFEALRLVELEKTLVCVGFRGRTLSLLLEHTESTRQEAGNAVPNENFSPLAQHLLREALLLSDAERRDLEQRNNAYREALRLVGQAMALSGPPSAEHDAEQHSAAYQAAIHLAGDAVARFFGMSTAPGAAEGQA
jgi:hypothetical protein